MLREEVVAVIVDKIIEAYNEHGRQELEAARTALIDTYAVMASAPRVYTKASQYAMSLGETGTREGIRVPGLGHMSTPRGAAAAMAFLSHSIEYDDWLAEALIHVGSVSIPIILAYGRERQMSEILKTIIASYEAALYLGSYYGRSHYTYWHSTSSTGALVAATAYILVRHGPQRRILESAIDVASAYMGGLWTVNNSQALYKPLSPANAVLTGLLAGTAAETEPARIPGALHESCRLLRGECTLKMFDKRGILLNGYKLYPTCRHSHTTIEAVKRLLEKTKVYLDGIKEIQVRVFKEAINVAGKQYPVSVEEARFSIPHLVTTMLLYRSVDFETISKSLNDPRIKSLRRKVVLVEDEDYTSRYPEEQPSTVTIKTGNKQYSETVLHPKGDPRRGDNKEEVLSKARSLKKYMPPIDQAILDKLIDAEPDTVLAEILE